MFYIIWSPESNLPPSRTFSSKKQAKKVITYLRATFPGQTFHMMEKVENEDED